MKRMSFLSMMLLAAGCAGQIRQMTFEEETAAVERFIARHTCEGKKGVTIRDGKKVLELKSSLDAERTGKVTFFTSFTVGKSSIELPTGFLLENGNILNPRATNSESIFQYLDDLDQIEDCP